MYSFILYCVEYDYINSNHTNYIFSYFYILIQQQVSNANNNQSSLKRNLEAQTFIKNKVISAFD